MTIDSEKFDTIGNTFCDVKVACDDKDAQISKSIIPPSISWDRTIMIPNKSQITQFDAPNEKRSTKVQVQANMVTVHRIKYFSYDICFVQFLLARICFGR